MFQGNVVQGQHIDIGDTFIRGTVIYLASPELTELECDGCIFHCSFNDLNATADDDKLCKTSPDCDGLIFTAPNDSQS